MFILIPVKFVAVLRKIKFLKNPRWRLCMKTRLKFEKHKKRVLETAVHIE